MTLESVLGSAEDVTSRLTPRPGDLLYIHLSDLLMFMRQIEIPANIKILDFGAGGSPYRTLFPGTSYIRADIDDRANPDLLISSEGRVMVDDSAFDVILSNQVAEHVSDYRDYLHECYRLCKPGGRLIITIPSMYEEHSCPSDYQRWMVEGISRDVENAGFVLSRIVKMTVGPRAIFFFLDRFLDSMQTSRMSLGGAAHFVFRKTLSPFRGIIHRTLDRTYPECRVVDVKSGSSNAFYLGIGIEAVKQL